MTAGLLLPEDAIAPGTRVVVASRCLFPGDPENGPPIGATGTATPAVSRMPDGSFALPPVGYVVVTWDCPDDPAAPWGLSPTTAWSVRRFLAF